LSGASNDLYQGRSRARGRALRGGAALSRLPVDEPVDNAGLAVLHETRRLCTVRPPARTEEMTEMS